MRVDFFVRPMESFFVGPPASFSAGEAHHATGRFPPSPMTFQGLVRSHLLYHARIPLNLGDFTSPAQSKREELVGGAGWLPSGWRLHGPYPRGPVFETQDGPIYRLWFPAPALLLHRPGKSSPVRAHLIGGGCEAMDDLEAPGWRSEAVGAPEQGDVKPLNGWISSRNLWHALSGQDRWDPEEHSVHHPPFVHRESHAGVQIDTKEEVAEHGLLYFLDCHRMDHDTGFVGSLEGEFSDDLDPTCLTRGFGHIGRKGRLVAFESGAGTTDPDWNALLRGDQIPNQIGDGARLWIYLASPACLRDVHRPNLRCASDVSLEFLGAYFKPATVIGGHSLTDRRMRPNRAFLPAGSCWMVSLHGGTEEERRRTLFNWNGGHIGSEEEAAFGFGKILVGPELNPNNA